MTPPDLATNKPLPVQRAFVVQLYATVAVAQGQLAGRVEHVLSGQATHFHTLEELMAFMTQILAVLDTAPEEIP